jgi:ubiquinone/menaquinone biosynthesis C-methylase UbiE
MMHDNQQVLEYWNRDEVESMYDKHLLNAEIELIKQRITPNAKILDAGCGEGEGTLLYSEIPGVIVHAVDFSQTRLDKAAKKLQGRTNVSLQQVDFLGQYVLANDYDIVISQRFMINLMEWDLQQKVLLGLMAMLKPSGRLLMLEGSKQGMESLNQVRAAFGLNPIPAKWHNLFFDDDELLAFMQQHSYSLLEENGLGTYFLLTRGVRPALEKELNWDCEFNRLAATPTMKRLLPFDTNFSRLKLWIFAK